MSKFESNVKIIPYSQDRVYNKISDLTNLESVKDKIPADKVQNLSFDTDTLSFGISPVGQIVLKVIEREPSKCVKFATETSPIPFNLWIQVLPTEENESKMKLTVKAEINMFMKGIVQKPLQEALDKLADTLAVIEY